MEPLKEATLTGTLDLRGLCPFAYMNPSDEVVKFMQENAGKTVRVTLQVV